MKLADIHQKYDTDKGTYHSYIDKYDEIFGPHRTEKFNFLEIGCLTCGSIKMFNEFFSDAHIYGLDNWAQITDHMGHMLANKGIDVEQIKKDIDDNYPRVHLKTCDSTDVDQVKQRLGDLKFKFIVDDGDHSPEAQFQTFKNFLPYLEKGGVYIIEDVGHIEKLAKDIQMYLNINYIEMRPELHGWYKGNRGDDAMIVIK